MYILPRMLLFYTSGYVDEVAYGLETSAKVNIIWRKGQASMPNKFCLLPETSLSTRHIARQAADR